MKWININDELPELEKPVLIYYSIVQTDAKRKPTGKIYHYREVAWLERIILTKKGKKGEFQNSEYQSPEPTYWCSIPEPPK